jgi:hypothetical protein
VIPRYFAIAMLCVWSLAGTAAAQEIPDDAPEQARMRLGPAGVTPSIALTRLGIDSNVFNEFDDPKRDFTFTLSPRIDAWLRAGRTRLHLAGRTDLVYFEKYSTERSVDGEFNGRLEVGSARLTPWVAGGYASGRQRMGYEVDLRFDRTIEEVSGGLDVQAGGRTRLGLAVQRSTHAHDPDAVFLSSSLRDVLDRRSDSLALRIHYALTPLTTFVVSGQAIQDRFEFAPARDSDSVRVDAGFDLAPSALISGRGRIGFRRLTGVDGGGLPEYSGMVASVSAASTIGGRTRLEVVSERDITYSFEAQNPYYILTGATLTATPRLTEQWDVQGRIGAHRLAYQAERGAPELSVDRVDTYTVRGAGVGYHVGRDLRIGVNVDHERRTSPVQRRVYEGYRAGISVTYGR